MLQCLAVVLTELLVAVISSAEVVYPIDLIFVIDGSMNAGEDNFNKELVFVRKLCNRFPITKNGVHVGLGVNSDAGLVAFNLKENQDNSSVNAGIDKLTYPGGASNVGKVLTKTRGWILNTSSRENAPKILLLLFKGTTADDIKAPSAQLQEDGVKIITIAVEADRVQANTISSIVMFENLVEFLYDSDAKLNRIVNMINEAAGVHSGIITEDLDEINEGRIKINSLHGDTPNQSSAVGGLTNNEDTTTPLEPVDIVFLIDGSNGVGKEDFENELKFLKNFVKRFPISEAMTRIALGTISDDGRVDLDFSRPQDARMLQNGLRLVTYPAGRMNAGKALTKVHEKIFKTYTRSGVAQVLVMIMKDRSLDDVKYIAADIREEGIKIIAIGLNKIHRDADAMSSITIFRDGVQGLLSDTKIEKYLYEKIKDQANNRT